MSEHLIEEFGTLCNKYDLPIDSTYIALIDCENALNWSDFKRECSRAFKFPDYFSGNMNSFQEIINDLSWLKQSNYLLVLINSGKLLWFEKEEEKSYLKDLFNQISYEWINVPNYSGEDEYRKKSKFIVHYGK